ncbi:hypothetical protein SAMN05421773_104124 [Streptomyces aidingensis]|uniref:Uncharacterized protein n=1 Tax=Streptomyces aidingensis TaxID=910347 RepID=A0A1I1KE00_9ACTN|nr:hypothetical protein SAMN05421773_104124 [Streptomyces aidingensis]
MTGRTLVGAAAGIRTRAASSYPVRVARGERQTAVATAAFVPETVRYAVASSERLLQTLTPSAREVGVHTRALQDQLAVLLPLARQLRDSATTGVAEHCWAELVELAVATRSMRCSSRAAALGRLRMLTRCVCTLLDRIDAARAADRSPVSAPRRPFQPGRAGGGGTG